MPELDYVKLPLPLKKPKLWTYPIAQSVLRLGYGLDDQGSGVRFPAGAGNISFQHRVQKGSGAYAVSYPLGTGKHFPAVKRPGREADHSPPSSAEVKSAWSYTSTPPLCLHGGVVLS
jgi:hypothetical protein